MTNTTEHSGKTTNQLTVVDRAAQRNADKH